MSRWWERFPERLERELQALRDSGIEFQRDEASFEAGVARLTVHPNLNGRRHAIEIIFPDLYPYFRFEARAAGLTLERHQNPATGQLCLLGRATDQWNPDDTVASLLNEQFPEILVANVPLADRREIREERQGEPYSDYLPYPIPTSLVIDGSWEIPPEVSQGTLEIGFGELGEYRRPVDVPRGAILSVRDDRGNILAQLDVRIAERFAHVQRGRWVRMQRPTSHNAEALFREIEAKDTSARKAQRFQTENAYVTIRAAIIPEETGYEQTGTGWIVAFEIEGEPKKGKGRPTNYHFARLNRLGVEDYFQRAPELKALQGARISVFGLGCVGAPSALEFARAGVADLRLLDGDYVDSSAVLRWPFGLHVVGHAKTEIIRQFIRANYPFTKVSSEQHSLGRTRDPDQPSDESVLDRILDNAPLIYDATAEFGVQYFLSRLARRRGLTYVGVAGKQGGWGGYIVRIIPGITEGCWSCLQLHWGGGIPHPPSADTAFIQPAGCGSPTFLAAGFDMAAIAQQGVRMAVGALCANSPGGYPRGAWDVLVIATRDEDGAPIAPTTQSFQLFRHPACHECAGE